MRKVLVTTRLAPGDGVSVERDTAAEFENSPLSYLFSCSFSPHGHVAAIYNDGSQSVFIFTALLSALRRWCSHRHMQGGTCSLEVPSGHQHRHRGHWSLLAVPTGPDPHQLPQNFICVYAGSKLLLNSLNLSRGVPELVEEVQLGCQDLVFWGWVWFTGIHFLAGRTGRRSEGKIRAGASESVRFGEDERAAISTFISSSSCPPVLENTFELCVIFTYYCGANFTRYLHTVGRLDLLFYSD